MSENKGKKSRKKALSMEQEPRDTEVLIEREPVEAPREPSKVRQPDISEEILGSLDSDEESLSFGEIAIRKENMADEARAEIGSMKSWRVPKNFITLTEHFEALSRALARSPRNSSLYAIVCQGIVDETSRIEWVADFEADDPIECLRPSKVVRAFIQGYPNAHWIFLPALLEIVNSTTYVETFKCRAAIEHWCERFKVFLWEYYPVDTEQQLWELDTSGEALSDRSYEFHGMVGKSILDEARFYSGDDRVQSHKSSFNVSSIQPQVDPPVAVAQSSHSFQGSSFLRNLKDVKLESINKKSIEAFKDAIRQNKIQSVGFNFNLDLLPNKIQLRLDNLWTLRQGKTSEPVDPEGWRKVPETEFNAFLDGLGDSYFLPRDDQSTLDHIYKQLKKGLSIDPFRIIESLEQIVEFQQELTEKNIICSKDQLKILDDLTLENLKGVHCSPTFKLKAKALKTELGNPTENTKPFTFFIKLCGKIEEVITQSSELLDWVDADYHKNVHMEQQKQRGQYQSIDNHPKSPKDPKRKFNPEKGGKQQTNPVPGDSKPSKVAKAICNHCGWDHPSSACLRIIDTNLDKSLLNTDASKSFADSDRGKYLVSKGFPPKFIRAKSPTRRDPNPAHKKKRTGEDKSSKCLLCYMSTVDNVNIPLINVYILSQANMEPKRTECLLDSGADVNYIDLDFINIINANNLIKDCLNCILCTGTNDCHPIEGVINLTINYTSEQDINYSITILVHIVRDLKYNLILGHESIRKHNLILHFSRNFFDPSSLPRYWDFQSFRGCGRITAVETGRDALDVRNKVQQNLTEGIRNSTCEVCSSPATDVQTSSRISHSLETYNSMGPNSVSDQISSLIHNNNKKFMLSSMNSPIRSDFEKEDIHEIRDDQMEAIPSEMLGNSELYEDELPKEIHGPESLQEKLRSLILQYKDIFSKKVRKTPAKLPPFNFKVDQGKWETYQNKTQPRRYDSTKSAALQKIVEQLLELGVIEPSDAAFYSHGFPVPKSTPGTWRLVVDLKNLNRISSTESWPIPNIKQLLQRL